MRENSRQNHINLRLFKCKKWRLEIDLEIFIPSELDNYAFTPRKIIVDSGKPLQKVQLVKVYQLNKKKTYYNIYTHTHPCECNYVPQRDSLRRIY